MKTSSLTIFWSTRSTCTFFSTCTLLSFHPLGQSVLSPPHHWHSGQLDCVHVAYKAHQLLLMTQQYGQGHDSYSVGLRGMTSCLSQNIGLVSLHEMGPRKDTGNESPSMKTNKQALTSNHLWCTTKWSLAGGSIHV